MTSNADIFMSKKPYAEKRITDQLLDSICKYIEMGATEKGAAILSDVPYDTAKRWKKEGRRGIEPYKKYYERVNTAKYKRQLYLLETMQRHAEKSPYACQWLFEKFEAHLDDEIDNSNSQVIIYKLPDNGRIIDSPSEENEGSNEEWREEESA